MWGVYLLYNIHVPSFKHTNTLKPSLSLLSMSPVWMMVWLALHPVCCSILWPGLCSTGLTDGVGWTVRSFGSCPGTYTGRSVRFSYSEQSPHVQICHIVSFNIEKIQSHPQFKIMCTQVIIDPEVNSQNHYKFNTVLQDLEKYRSVNSHQGKRLCW